VRRLRRAQLDYYAVLVDRIIRRERGDFGFAADAVG
jgi:hypothetical protein